MKLTQSKYNSISKRLTQILLVIVGMVSVSCSEDNGRGGDDYQLHPSAKIQMKVTTKDASTRALGSFSGTPTANELINTCVVAFVNTADGTIAETVTLPSSTGVSSQEFSAYLKAGDYKAYAFANFDESAISNLNISKESKLTIETFEASLYSVDANALSETSLIPMSGMLADIKVAANGSVTVGGTAMTSVTMTVVRMVGKLEFEFINNSTTDITVKEITFKPAATGDIKLLPSDGISAGEMIEAGITKTPTLKINKNSDDEPAEEASSSGYSFYVREVKSDHPTGCFPIIIKYTIGESETEETMTALLYDLTEIKRNDWIRVPIKLTDRKLELEVEFYPPIGGYPPVTLKEEEDEYYVTFGTGGWFSIEASVVNKGDGSTVANKYVEISIPEEGGVSNSSFFRRQPTVESSGEITGEIASGLTEGAKSIVTIEVKLTDKGADGKDITTETFKRKIHFVYSEK